jgi:hypothetical protein
MGVWCEIPLRHLDTGVAEPVLHRPDVYATPQCPRAERIAEFV